MSIATEQDSDEIFFELALTAIPGIGPVAGRSIIGYLGSAQALFKESRRTLAKIPGIGDILAKQIHSFSDFDKIEAELEYCRKNQIAVIGLNDSRYPLRLKQIPDSPLVLFMKGQTNLNHNRMVAIVGTRKNSRESHAITYNLIEELKPYNVHIISGLAYGIDICAHKAALDLNVPTIGVVGHGLDILYPGDHLQHARSMVEKGGAVLSEMFHGTNLNKDLFPRRNRIVAGLCDALIVVESGVQGGSMITADLAAGYNRDVFAIPGRPGEPASSGCNLLIKQLKAALCDSAKDIADGMNWEPGCLPKATGFFQPSLLPILSPDEITIVDLIQNGTQHFDDILIQSGISMNTLSFMLLEMEMKGVLKSYPGKTYSLLR